MKRSLPALAFLLGCASVVSPAAPASLVTLHAIHALSNADASHAIPVAFEATVTYNRSYEGTLFVEDGDDSIYVQAPPTLKFAPGDRVLVKGKTHDSFRPEIFADSVELLHHGSLPKAVPADFDELIRGDLDCALVTVHGVVRTADIVVSNASPVRSITLEIMANGGIVHVSLDSNDASALEELLDAEVEVTGAASGRFDGKNQLTGIDLNVTDLSGIHILKRANVSPWSIPATSMGEILSSYHVENRSRRVLLHGVITYYQPGSMVVLQNGGTTIRVMTRTYNPLRVGDLADATGFPDLADGFLTLTDSEVQDSLVQAPVQPISATWEQLAASGNIFDLVSIEGKVVMAVREAAQDEYVIVSNGHLFSARYRHPDSISQLALPPMKDAKVNSTVRIVGICVPYTSDAFSGPVPFDILLRSFDDVTVVANPSWVTVPNLMKIVGALFLLVLAAGLRSWLLDRQHRLETSALAYIERRRSRILEDINGTRALAEILEQITELVSFKLKGAPCWCHITDGAQLGNCPPKFATMRIERQEIHGHSGSVLGEILAAFDPLTEARSLEAESLAMAASLAALAIETRKLYSDLRRRSEFDLLTDTHNRFSLDKHLDAMITEARNAAGIFGFIYIDLDEFKQINDFYGHQVGDRYLQEVALRMKRQLRSHDLLARQGGDEFAALVPVVRSRVEVEEIAERLERCFDEPFAIDDYTVQGSASVGIAIYPSDGDTKDALLNTADAAMYREKHARR
jgi:diguanylate cyclase (GGDEF)-like protein